MDDRSNWINFTEEVQPPTQEFVDQYWELLKDEIPQELKFLRDFNVKNLGANKSYMLILFEKRDNPSRIMKFSLINEEDEGVVSLIENERNTLDSISKHKISPQLIYSNIDKGEQSEILPKLILTSLEGLGNNLSGWPTQEWWEKDKEKLVECLAKLHDPKNKNQKNKTIGIRDWANNYIFNEDICVELLLEPETPEEIFDFLDLCKIAFNNILDELDEKDFVLCHNNICKSSVLYDQTSEQKFKFINFHKSVIGPRELDIHAVYHRLGLEKYDFRSSGNVCPKDDLEILYKKHTGKDIFFSQDMRFINTIQRLILLLFENNMPPVALFQSDPFYKLGKRKTEFNFLKRRLYSIICDHSFSQREFFEYYKSNKLPFTELNMYG